MLATVIEKPGIGYAVGNHMAERYGRVLASGTTHVYEHLDRLAESGFVEATPTQRLPRADAPAPSDRMHKHYFRATPDGVDWWRRWLRSPLDSKRAMTDVLVRLCAVRPDDVATMRAIVDEYDKTVSHAAGQQHVLSADATLPERMAADLAAGELDYQLGWISDVRARLRAEEARRR